MSLFLASVGFGLVTASVLAIASVGFTLQFGVTDVLNLAFGAVMIFSAFVAYLLNSSGISVWIGLLAAMAAGPCAPWATTTRWRTRSARTCCRCVR